MSSAKNGFALHAYVRIVFILLLHVVHLCNSWAFTDRLLSWCLAAARIIMFSAWSLVYDGLCHVYDVLCHVYGGLDSVTCMMVSVTCMMVYVTYRVGIDLIKFIKSLIKSLIKSM